MNKRLSMAELYPVLGESVTRGLAAAMPEPVPRNPLPALPISVFILTDAQALNFRRSDVWSMK